MGAGLWTMFLIFYRQFDRPNSSGISVDVSVNWGIFIAFLLGALLAYAGFRIRASHRPEPIADDVPPRPARPCPRPRRRPGPRTPIRRSSPAGDPARARRSPTPTASCRSTSRPSTARRRGRAPPPAARPLTDGTSAGEAGRMPLGVGFTPFETRAEVIVRLGVLADELGLGRVEVAEGWTHDSTDPAGRARAADLAHRAGHVGDLGVGPHARDDRARRRGAAALLGRPLHARPRRRQPADDRGLPRHRVGAAAGPAAPDADRRAGAADRRAAPRPRARRAAAAPGRAARRAGADRRWRRCRPGRSGWPASSPTPGLRSCGRARASRRAARCSTRASPRPPSRPRRTSAPGCPSRSAPTSAAPGGSPPGGWRPTPRGWGRCTRGCSASASAWPPASTRSSTAARGTASPTCRQPPRSSPAR